LREARVEATIFFTADVVRVVPSSMGVAMLEVEE
jgi:hypothetical protein